MMLKAGAALIWTLVVAFLTLLPGKDLPEISIVNFDKVAHLGVFAILEFLYLRWIGKRYLWITAACIIYGGLLEVLQGAFYVDRYADIWDFVFNGLGCIVALLVVKYWIKSRT
jgi:VanZ family protein